MGRGFFYFRRQAGRRSLLRALVFTSIVSLLAATFYATAQMRPLLESLKDIDQDLLKGAVSGAQFQTLFFARCKDQGLADFVRTLL